MVSVFKALIKKKTMVLFGNIKVLQPITELVQKSHRWNSQSEAFC